MLQNKKSLGQNWLYDREILNQIADLAAKKPQETPLKPHEILEEAPQSHNRADAPETPEKPQENHSRRTTPEALKDLQKPPQNAPETKLPLCLEVGPGLGTLTASLLRRFKKVIAVEFDEKLAENLPGSFPGTNLEVINADILSFNFGSLESPYAIAGNIPYYITKPLIKKVLETKNRPEKIVFLVQKEVAEKIANENTSFSLYVRNLAAASLGPVVKRDKFTPPPKVDSEVLILDPHPEIVDEETMSLIRLGFSAPRKKLLNNLASQFSHEKIENSLKKLNFPANSRPGDLNLEDWQAFKNVLKSS